MAPVLIDTSQVAALLDAAHSGRRDAWTDLIGLCRPLVERHARKHAWSNTDVEDVVQEVWIRLLRHAGRIRDPHALVGWLTVVTRRLAAELGHRNARAIPSEIDEESLGAVSTEDEALRLHDRGRVTHGVRAALQHLSEADRELLLLLHQDGAPNYAEVSLQVERPIGSLGPTRRRLLDRLGRDPAVRPLAQACV